LHQKTAENEEQYNLGSCDKFRIDIEKEEIKPFEYYKKSAEKEHADVQIQLEIDDINAYNNIQFDKPIVVIKSNNKSNVWSDTKTIDVSNFISVNASIS